MNTNNWAHAGGKKPTAPGMENIPPALLTDLPTTLLKTPSFPKKRPRSTSHYTGGDCSPSKRRDLGISKSTAAKDERSPLFGDATNSCAKTLANEVDKGDVPFVKPKTTGMGRAKKGGSKKRMKMEIMIPLRSGHPTRRELETDVQVDVFN